MSKKKYIKIPKGFFDKLDYKIEWDWDSFFKVKRMAILERLLETIENKPKKRKPYTGDDLV